MMIKDLFNPHRLQNRIIVVYLVLLVVIQAISYWVIEDSIDRNAQAAINAQLDTGERVVTRLLSLGDRPLDQALLSDMKSLSGLEMAFLQPSTDSDWRVSASTLPVEPSVDELAPTWKRQTTRARAPNVTVHMTGHRYTARFMPLDHTGSQGAVTAVLLSSYEQALAPYSDFKLTLLVLGATGLLIFGVGGFLTAKRIATPLRLLTDSAKSLEKGDYSTEVHTDTEGEIGELAYSFECMRLAIQTRESEIRRLAYQDTVTDLPNREHFRHDLRTAMAQTRLDGSPCAVMMLDLDRFKDVNDLLGHRFGDRLLRAVAERLSREALSNSSVVLARLGGDEFGILLPGADAAAALTVSDHIRLAFESPIVLDEHTVDLSAGIGIAVGPIHGTEADTLLSRAELAMYAAKKNQSGTVVYHPGLDSTSEESLTLLGELRYALDHDQMRLFLQPKINLQTGKVVGAEALVRWQHPTRGMVPPTRFIPFAEQTGFVRVLTMWMLERVARMSQALSQRGLTLKLAVNLSARDLMDHELTSKIEALLIQHKMDPALLVLEITESAIMDDPQRALVTLNRLHSMGMKLSIDDFGTGYSSLAYLKRLPVDELKIDKSFVMNMESDLQDAKIVYSTIDLAHNLGLSVVAEGVENAKAWKLLTGLGCDEVQGYFVSKPMAAHAFPDWVEAWEAPDTEQEHLATAFAAMI